MFLGDGVAVVTYQGLILWSKVPHFGTRHEGKLYIAPSLDPKYCHLLYGRKAENTGSI